MAIGGGSEEIMRDLAVRQMGLKESLMTIFARDWIDYHSVTTPNKIAMIDLMSERRFTYKELHERAGRVAGFLKSKGIQKGDRVAYLCLNTTDVMELIFGCWRIGAVCLALNFRLTPPELAFILNDSETSMVLVDEPFKQLGDCLLYTSPSPRDKRQSRMPSSA